MNYMVPAMPLWLHLAIVALVAAGASIPSAAFGARRGARMTILTCSAHNDCAMVKAAERVGWTKQLKRQHDELMREHPDALARRRAAEDVDRSEQPKVDGRKRSKEDEGIDGNR